MKKLLIILIIGLILVNGCGPKTMVNEKQPEEVSKQLQEEMPIFDESLIINKNLGRYVYSKINREDDIVDIGEFGDKALHISYAKYIYGGKEYICSVAEYKKSEEAILALNYRMSGNIRRGEIIKINKFNKYKIFTSTVYEEIFIWISSKYVIIVGDLDYEELPDFILKTYLERYPPSQ